MIFQVWMDDKLLAESPLVRANDAWHLDVPLPPGGKMVRLVATDAGDGINCDHADWADAGFIPQGAHRAPRPYATRRLDRVLGAPCAPYNRRTASLCDSPFGSDSRCAVRTLQPAHRVPMRFAVWTGFSVRRAHPTTGAPRPYATRRLDRVLGAPCPPYNRRTASLCDPPFGSGSRCAVRTLQPAHRVPMRLADWIGFWLRPTPATASTAITPGGLTPASSCRVRTAHCVTRPPFGSGSRSPCAPYRTASLCARRLIRLRAHPTTGAPRPLTRRWIGATDAGDGINCDHADWADAGFIL
ncbi:NPCBM/NEW2 domain-containing protein [bacterium]|nr:NPCBM/NEW2 domain-containing protein [bacterium]